MSSFAVKSEITKLVFSILALFCGAALEQLCPKTSGVGFPVLLAIAQFESRDSAALPAMLFAVAAGGVEDAISSLPIMTSASYFLLVAVMTRWAGLPRALLLLTYPGYQVWLRIWVGSSFENIYNRLLVALPMGIVTGFVVWGAFMWLKERSAIDEE